MFFRDNYFFLSNMYPCEVIIDGYTFKCAEAAFQAIKCPSRVSEFLNLDGYAAKRLGRTVELRSDWEENKNNFMFEVVKSKFLQNNYLKQKLLETGEIEIVEDNFWKDTYWGKYNGVGKNHLGKILMAVRSIVLEMEKIC